MIFKKQPKAVVGLSKHDGKLSWKQKFRVRLYRTNYKNLLKVENKISKSGHCEEAAYNLIINLRKNPKIYKENPAKNCQEMYHPFCVYIPLKKSIQIDDEIVNTFIYLRNLKEVNNFVELDNFYTKIRKFLQSCKENNKVMEGWNVCLKRFVVGLDLLQRIQIYIHILKYGSQYFSQLHQKFAKATLIDVFIQRVLVVNKYFQKQVRINKTWKISVQLNDRINQANISKTMKMLYCSICLIYDCGKHKLEEISHRKDHHYSSPKNQIPKSDHIANAISLLKQLRDLEYEIEVQKQDGCSEECYRKLDKATFIKKQLMKSKLMSPMVQSLINIGIELYSYCPCKISNLFPKDPPNHSKITCSIIFLYLIQQINLQQKLNNKINSNQIQFLKRECSKDTTALAIKTENKNIIPQKKKKNKMQRTKQYKYCQVATCFHWYIGEQNIDESCQLCVCHLRGFCLPECQCGLACPLLVPGCSCKSKQDCQLIKCFCYQAKIQCIPGVCHNCFPDNGLPKRNNCKNDQILRGMSQQIKIGKSQIPGAGFGAFAHGKIKKGSLIFTYCGQLLEQEMEGIRETLKKDQSFYNFACSEGSIDARFMGNKTRFINHSNEYEPKTNLVSLNMFSCGQEFIGLYASRDIQDGQQLLFDYDVEGEVAKMHSSSYTFLRKDGKVKIQGGQ